MTYTLNEVLSYSSSLQLETKGFIYDPMFYMALFIIAFGLVICSAVFNMFRYVSLPMPPSGLAVLLIVVLGLVFIMFGGYFFSGSDGVLTADSRKAFDQQERQWEQEVVPAFLDGLPIAERSDIQKVSPNKNWSTGEESRLAYTKAGLKPLIVEMKDGKSFEVWAKEQPLKEGMTENRLDFKYLKKDLQFHERSEVFMEKGYVDVILYTNEEKEREQKHVAQEQKWIRDVAIPHMEQLPLKSEMAIDTIEYDKDLEKTSEKPSPEMVPVKVTAKDGEAYSLWAEVIKLDDNLPSLLTFTHLENDLRFNEYAAVYLEKGYYNGTLYTNQKSFEMP